MPTPRRVLVTGSAGRLGRAAVAELAARGHYVVGLDLRQTPGLPPERSVVAGLDDDAALRRAMTGADCVVHLAATPDDDRYPRGEPPDDGDNFLSELVPNNVVGPYRVLEAARVAGVRRAVLASTGQVIAGHFQDGVISIGADAPYRPRYLYACTKVFLEALGQVYAKDHGIAVLAVRLGWCPRDAAQEATLAGAEVYHDVYLSPGDAGRFFAAAVEADGLPPFAAVYATSRPARATRFDLSDARRLLEWEPRDQWPEGAGV